MKQIGDKNFSQLMLRRELKRNRVVSNEHHSEKQERVKTGEIKTTVLIKSHTSPETKYLTLKNTV